MQRSYVSSDKKSLDCATYDSKIFGWYHKATEQQCEEHCSAASSESNSVYTSAPTPEPLPFNTPPPVKETQYVNLMKGEYKITNLDEITGKLDEPIEIAVGSSTWTFPNPRTGHWSEDYYVIKIMDENGNKLPSWQDNWINLNKARG